MNRLKHVCSFTVLFIGVTSMFLISCGVRDNVTTLKISHSHDRTHSKHQGVMYLAERVYEKSNGLMRVEIYPSGQLGSQRENLEMLQIGSLAMTIVSAAVMENFAPSFRVFGLPYIFSDREHAHRVWDGDIGRDVMTDGEEFWLRGLAFYDAGSRSFYTNDRPIHHPDDLRGLKIRVMPSPMAVEMIRTFGGSPTPISWGELYTALQGGVVDGAENNPPSLYLSRHYEVSRHFSLNEHTRIPDVILISTKIWNTLSPQEQQWLQEAAYESAAHQRVLWLESERHSLQQLEEAGVNIIIPDKQPFIDRVQVMHSKFKEDETLYGLIRRIQAIQ